MPSRRLQPASIGLFVGVMVMLAAGLIVVGVSLEGKPTGTDGSDVPLAIFLDSPVSLASMEVASLLMTLIVMRWPRPIVGILVIVFSLAFAIVDGLEWSSKASMGAIGFATFAAVILFIRLATAATAAMLLRRPSASPPQRSSVEVPVISAPAGAWG